ncbi:hypothetical protein AN618_21480 [Fervidicola ferrireducens]|uniref:Uncharacterized protein n=1 Tax=Fervidicola ferrireducens TaxID=520764 RepID=A0A140L2T1_9FIRM|nr:hypothetical protein [Fervidicola ferrireducens]KXG74856.1 hypothetical protein AN618_21480 [Fervidicola ferrireducens]
MPQRKGKSSSSDNQSEKRKLMEPAYIEGGKYACPKCLSREYLKIVDYDCAEEGKFLFIVKCSKCRTEFRVKKYV